MDGRKFGKDLAIIVDCQDADYRKFSIRTTEFDDERFNIPRLLDLAYRTLPPHMERNYGGHQTSGGATCRVEDSADVLRQILYTHFEQIGQPQLSEKLSDYDLFFP